MEWKSYQCQSLENYLTGKEVLQAPEFGKKSIVEGSPTRARGWKSIPPAGSPTNARVLKSISPGKEILPAPELIKYLTGKEFLQAPELGKVSHLEGSASSARV